MFCGHSLHGTDVDCTAGAGVGQWPAAVRLLYLLLNIVVRCCVYETGRYVTMIYNDVINLQPPNYR